MTEQQWLDCASANQLAAGPEAGSHRKLWLFTVACLRRDEALLDHCRQPGEHVRGCWVVDLLLEQF